MGGRRSPSSSSSSSSPPVAKKKEPAKKTVRKEPPPVEKKRPREKDQEDAPPPKKKAATGDAKKEATSTKKGEKKVVEKSDRKKADEKRRDDRDQKDDRDRRDRREKERDRDRSERRDDRKRDRDRRGDDRDRDRDRRRDDDRDRDRNRDRDRDRVDRGGARAHASSAGATDSRSLHATNPWASYYPGSFAGWGTGASSSGGASWGSGSGGGGGGGGGKSGGKGWGGNRTEYDEAAFSSFNRTSARGKDTWMPGRGRNPDLDAERMSGAGGGSTRWYSDHDDRRGDAPAAPVRRAPSPDKWKHDLFDAVVSKENSKKEIKDVKKESRDGNEREAVEAKPGLRVQNKHGRLGVIVKVEPFTVKFDDDPDEEKERPMANFYIDSDWIPLKKPTDPVDNDGDDKASSKPADKDEKKKSKDGDGDDDKKPEPVEAKEGMRVQNKNGRLGVCVKVDPFTVKFDDDKDEEKERPIANFYIEGEWVPLKKPPIIKDDESDGKSDDD